jgi:hypothetical protein
MQKLACALPPSSDEGASVARSIRLHAADPGVAIDCARLKIPDRRSGHIPRSGEGPLPPFGIRFMLRSRDKARIVKDRPRPGGEE